MGEGRARFCFGWTRARCQDQDKGVSDPGREPETRERWAELFDQLDLNKDGKVDINELRIGLAARGLLRSDAEEVRGIVMMGVFSIDVYPLNYSLHGTLIVCVFVCSWLSK